MKRWLVTLMMLVALPAGAQQEKERILDCIRAAVPDALRVRNFELESTDRAGSTTVLRGRVWAMREMGPSGRKLGRIMLRVEAPDNLAGASYLVRQGDDYLSDGMYVYLPSVRRVRRVTGTFADGSMLGTSFSYNDFKHLENAFGGMEATLEEQEEVDERWAHRLFFRAPPGSETKYSSVRVWVDQKTCVPVKADFYEGNDPKPAKQFLAGVDSLKKAGGYWYASVIEMFEPREGNRSVLRFTGAAPSNELPQRYFDPNAFAIGS